MPYIPKSNRVKFDRVITDAVYELSQNNDPGELNYFFSSVLWRLLEKNKRYKTINDIIGALECIKLEFYRRQAASYEDEKIKINGDVF